MKTSKCVILLSALLLIIISFTYGKDQGKKEHQHHRRHNGMHGQHADHNKPKTIVGYVMDDEGKAVWGADIIIPQKFISVKSDKTGRFSIPFDGEGTVHVEVYKTGYMPGSTKPFKKGNESRLNLPMIVLHASPLEEVVVTGTSTPKLYRETAVKTTVTSKREIEKKGAVSLADSLEMMTGVRVENNCQNCNFNQVRLSGMEGKYSQILVNGMPVVSALAGVYVLEQMPANMIDQLEVVKGGGSALYGGNAIAGVVNVVTKEAQESGSQLAFTQESIQGEPNTILNFNSDYVSKTHDTVATFFANYQDRSPMDYNDDGFSDSGELTNLSLGSNFSHNFSNLNGKLKLSFNAIFEDRRGGNKFDQPEHYADIAEAARTYRADFGMGWEQVVDDNSLLKFDGSFSYTKRKSYYGAEQDPDAYGNTTNPVFFGTLTYNHLGIKNHGILAGFTFRSDHLNDQVPGYNRFIDETYTDIGAFLQDEIELFNNEATVLVGLRADKHSEIDSLILSPRASILYKGIKNLTLRGTFSTGFRAPQVFDEDLHIAMVGGEGFLITNSSDLKEERSYSFTFGLDYGKQVINKLYQFSIGGFFNRLNDAFTLRETDQEIDNARVFERFNSSGAKVYGIELEAGFKLAGTMEIFTGWTFQRSRLDDPEPDFNSRTIFRSPDVYGSVRLDWMFPKLFDVRVEYSFTGPMKVPHFAGYIAEDVLEDSDSFSVINLTFTRKIKVFKGKYLTLRASVLNLFDEYQNDLDRGIYRDAGYVYGPRLPRSFRFGFRYNF